MNKKRNRDPKWSEIPRPINGHAHLELVADLEQSSPMAPYLKPFRDSWLAMDNVLKTFSAHKMPPPTPRTIQQWRDEGWIDADQYDQMMRSVVPSPDHLTGTTS